jgi:uncharacterized membrane protein
MMNDSEKMNTGAGMGAGAGMNAGTGMGTGMGSDAGMRMMSGETGPERIYAFSDGVFAIIITIMILELKKPESATFHALFELWPTWLGYGVSYLFIAIVWINHHFLMRFAQTANLKLMWVNFAHLFCVSVIPFLTRWLSDTRLAPVPVAMYAFDFILVNITYLMLVFATICDDTVRTITAKARSSIHLRFAVTLGLFTIAMIVAFWFPPLSFALIVCCLVLYIKPDVPRLIKDLDMQHQPGMGFLDKLMPMGKAPSPLMISPENTIPSQEK